MNLISGKTASPSLTGLRGSATSLTVNLFFLTYIPLNIWTTTEKGCQLGQGYCQYHTGENRIHLQIQTVSALAQGRNLYKERWWWSRRHHGLLRRSRNLTLGKSLPVGQDERFRYWEKPFWLTRHRQTRAWTLDCFPQSITHLPSPSRPVIVKRLSII